jgi:hypothetical protein
MNTLIAEENNLLEAKEYLVNQLDELTYEIEDLREDVEAAHYINHETLQNQYNQVYNELLTVVSAIACIGVQKEIVRTLMEKGLTEEAALKVAKESSPQ